MQNVVMGLQNTVTVMQNAVMGLQNTVMDINAECSHGPSE